MKMKNFLAILLIGMLAISLISCETRESLEDTNTVAAEEKPEEVAVPDETIPDIPEETGFTPEEISANLSVAAKLLENAEKCDVIYRGLLEIDENSMPQTTDGEDEYFLVLSDLYDSSDIEKLWTSTFVMEGIASKAYDQMVADKLYMNFNGELHAKSSQADAIPPITMGSWDIKTGKLVSVAEDKVVISMETQLVGQPNGEKELTLVKVNDSWILAENYFLD